MFRRTLHWAESQSQQFVVRSHAARFQPNFVQSEGIGIGAKVATIANFAEHIDELGEVRCQIGKKKPRHRQGFVS
jgi:hypothetical protein